MNGWEGVATIISALAALVFVLVAAYVTLRWMSRRMSPQTDARLIKVLDRVMIGQDKCLLVVQIGEQAMLIGMSQQCIEKLTDLEQPLQLSQTNAKGTAEFSDFLKDTLKSSWAGLGKKGGTGSE